jgi:glycosyltransferase involved in cell wall biosynthesis
MSSSPERLVYFVGRVGKVEQGNTRSALDVLEVLRENGYPARVLSRYRKNSRPKAFFIGLLNRLRRGAPHTVIVNGLGGMDIFDEYYKGFHPSMLIVRESPEHFRLKGNDPAPYVPRMNRFGTIVFVSAIARAKWEALGVRKTDTFYLPNTIRDVAPMPSAPAAAALEPTDKLTVLIVGSFQYRKAQDTVVRTVLETPALQEHFRFVFVGGLNNTYARDLVKSAENCDSLIFMGLQEASGFYPIADIVLQPSRAEAMSRVILEAIKYGKTLICTDIEGSAEIIEDGVDGLLIPPDDPPHMAEALERLYADPTERARLAEAAKNKFADQYSWDVYRDRWRAFLVETIPENSRDGPDLFTC